MGKIHVSLITALTAAMTALGSTGASALDLNGAFSTFVLKPSFTSHCTSGVADECGVIQFVGLGAADWAYAFGPTFEPTGERSCFYVDGTLAITLHSDGSTISGQLTGVFCSRLEGIAQEHAGRISYGNPFFENDTVQFSNGTGQFAGLQGTADFHTFGAGAVFQGSLTGTLSD